MGLVLKLVSVLSQYGRCATQNIVASHHRGLVHTATCVQTFSFNPQALALGAVLLGGPR